MLYDHVFLDITSNCNLRCPFCVNDWSKISGNVNITKENFKKTLEYLPLANHFMISCSFEPTIHPNFIELLEMIPEKGKDNSFFTTNLSNNLPDDFFERLAKVNIKFLNVSYYSHISTIYEALRVGAKFDTFDYNLDKLLKTFRYADNPPKIRFITMALRQNYENIPKMVSVFNGYEYEVRTPFPFTVNHMNKEWAEKSLLTADECKELKTKLPEKVQFYNLLHEYNGESTNILRISSDGEVI